MSDLRELHEAMTAHGLQPRAELHPGKMHRFPGDGKGSTNGAGWCHVFEDGDGAAFGDWSTGLSETWQRKRERPRSPAEQAAFAEQVRRARELAAQEREEKHRQAATRAMEAWRLAEEGPTPYTERKGVSPTRTMKRLPTIEAVRQAIGYIPQSDGVPLDAPMLVLPIKVAGKLSSLEFIGANGRKSALAGGRKSGGYWSADQLPEGDGEGITFAIGEGCATVLSAHEATDWPVVAAFSSGNLLPVAKTMRTLLPKVRIVLLADLGNGEAQAHEAAAAVGGLVYTPEFGTDRRDGEKDANDFASRFGLEALKTALERAQPPTVAPEAQPAAENRSTAVLASRGDPKPLTVAIEPQAYPLDALPGRIGANVREFQAFSKVPVAMAASSALGVVAAVSQGLVDVCRLPGLQGPSSLFLLTIGGSGERKTTSDDHFSGALKAWIENREAADATKRAEARANKEAWEARCQGLRDAIKQHAKTGDSLDAESARQSLVRELAEEPPSYKRPITMRGEDTPEALAKAAATDSHSLAILSGEGGNILGGHGMRPESVMKTLSQLNVFWDGGSIKRGRMSQSSDISVKAARLSVHLMVQSGVIQSFFNGANGLARDSGFMARFLISHPVSTIGTRFVTQPPSWKAKEAFDRRIAELLDMQPPADQTLEPKLLKLSPPAFNLWRDYQDQVERESALGHELHDVKDIAAKTGDNAARLAAIFHVFERGQHGEIGAESMTAGIRIAAWHLDEARRFLGSVDIPAELVNASHLDSWLREYVKRPAAERKENAPLAPNEVLTKTICQFGPGHMRKKQDVDAALAELSEQDRAWVETRDRMRIVVVHPQLCGGAQ